MTFRNSPVTSTRARRGIDRAGKKKRHTGVPCAAPGACRQLTSSATGCNVAGEDATLSLRAAVPARHVAVATLTIVSLIAAAVLP